MLSRRLFMTAVIAIGASAAGAQQSPTVTLDEFIDLSQRLLGRAAVDREIAQQFLTAIRADADDAVTLAWLVQSNGNPTPEQRVLAASIIDWWQTGVFEMGGERRLATRSRATWTAYPSQMFYQGRR